MAELFGFEIKRKEDKKTDNIPSFIQPGAEEGSIDIAATGTAASSFLDLNGSAKSEAETEPWKYALPLSRSILALVLPAPTNTSSFGLLEPKC